MLEIPLISVNNQELNIILNEQNCTIAIYQRDDNTYLDLSVNDKSIKKGALCIPKAPILLKPCDFVGQFYIVDTESTPTSQAKPDYTQLGTRFKLFYLNEKEEAQADHDRYYNRV